MIVSLFGSENMPTQQNPDSIAEDVTQWVKQYDLDGVDVDYEVRCFHLAEAWTDV